MQLLPSVDPRAPVESLLPSFNRYQFYILLTVGVLAGASCLYGLLGPKQGHEGHQNFQTPGNAIFSTISLVLLGGYDPNYFDVDGGTDLIFEDAAKVVYVLTTFIVSIILLNLLIAILSDSHERLLDRREMEFTLAKARIVDSLERGPLNYIRLFVLAAVPYLKQKNNIVRLRLARLLIPEAVIISRSGAVVFQSRSDFAVANAYSC